MEQITLGAICAGIALIVTLIKGFSYLKKSIKDWIAELLKDYFDNINSNLKTLQDRVDEIDVSTCKNFLVARLSQIENGNDLGEIEKERFWEQYEHYCSIGGNSYIHNKVEQLKSEGKI